MYSLSCLAAAFSVILVAGSIKLPDYIQPCSFSAPNLNECALNSTKNALPRMVKGDKTFKLPPLDPMFIPEITMQSGGNLKVKFTNAKIFGIGSSDIKDLTMDFENNIISSEFYIEHFNLLAKYAISGTILVVPIEGQGPVNITMNGALFKYSFTFDLLKKEGRQYISPVNPKVTFTTERSYFGLGNLFSGNELLSSSVNNFIDENWELLQSRLMPDVGKAIAKIITAIARSYLDRISIEEMFLP